MAKGHGGKREGAGRKPGSFNSLGYGEVKATKAARLRLPKDMDEDSAEMAAAALQRIIDVMAEKVHYTKAGHVLKAATRLREEVCGPLTQKLEHTGPEGGPLQVVVQKLPKEE